MTTVAKMAALKHLKSTTATRMATPRGRGPIPVTVDTFEAWVGWIPSGGRGGLANREPASCAVHFTDCCGFSWRRQPNKRIPRDAPPSLCGRGQD